MIFQGVIRMQIFGYDLADIGMDEKVHDTSYLSLTVPSLSSTINVQKINVFVVNHIEMYYQDNTLWGVKREFIMEGKKQPRSNFFTLKDVVGSKYISKEECIINTTYRFLMAHIFHYIQKSILESKFEENPCKIDVLKSIADEIYDILLYPLHPKAGWRLRNENKEYTEYTSAFIKRRLGKNILRMSTVFYNYDIIINDKTDDVLSVRYKDLLTVDEWYFFFKDIDVYTFKLVFVEDKSSCILLNYTNEIIPNTVKKGKFIDFYREIDVSTSSTSNCVNKIVLGPQKKGGRTSKEIDTIIRTAWDTIDIKKRKCLSNLDFNNKAVIDNIYNYICYWTSKNSGEITNWMLSLYYNFKTRSINENNFNYNKLSVLNKKYSSEILLIISTKL